MSESAWVEITHPNLPDESKSPEGGHAVVTQEAFDEVWRDLGWTIAEPDPVPVPSAPPLPEPPTAYASVVTEAAPVNPEPAEEQATQPDPLADEPKPKTTAKKGK